MIKRTIKFYEYTILTDGDSISVKSVRHIAVSKLKKEAEDKGLEFKGYIMNISVDTYQMPVEDFLKNAVRVDG